MKCFKLGTQNKNSLVHEYSLKIILKITKCISLLPFTILYRRHEITTYKVVSIYLLNGENNHNIFFDFVIFPDRRPQSSLKSSKDRHGLSPFNING